MAFDASGLRALTFDTFGTVVDWRSSIIREFSAFGGARGITADWAALVDAWKTAYKPGMDAVRKGLQPWTTVDGIYRAKLDALLPAHGIRGLDDADKAHLTRAWHRLDPWPDAVDGLTRLKRRFVISPLSNGDVACLTNMAKRAGLPWDVILCAELFRHYKPDPEVYLGAIGYLGCRPHEVMMVAAHNYDLAAARSHGMRTAFIPRPAEFGPGQTTDLGPESDWDIVATDIVDLAAQLGA